MPNSFRHPPNRRNCCPRGIVADFLQLRRPRPEQLAHRFRFVKSPLPGERLDQRADVVRIARAVSVQERDSLVTVAVEPFAGTPDEWDAFVRGAPVYEVVMHEEGGDPVLTLATLLQFWTHVVLGIGVLVWGGATDDSVLIAAGGKYVPALDAWQGVASIGSPSAMRSIRRCGMLPRASKAFRSTSHLAANP